MSIIAWRLTIGAVIVAWFALSLLVIGWADRRWDRRHPWATELDAAARQRIKNAETYRLIDDERNRT